MNTGKKFALFFCGIFSWFTFTDLVGLQMNWAIVNGVVAYVLYRLSK